MVNWYATNRYVKCEVHRICLEIIYILSKMDDPEVIGEWARERILGCGGFGIVTLWKNTKNYESIAIKKYRGDNDNLTQKHKDRWTQEVEMMKRINNENIVKFRTLPSNLEETLNKHNPSNLPMLSMEYCTQGDLRSVLSRSENCCGLPESDVRYILKDLMNAVSYLHSEKITHRDLKPENIVLQVCNRANGIIYKLIDLGYAKELDAKSICASFVGTLQYLAPELLYSKTYSCSVDYWSMGLVAFEIISGTRPFLPNKSPAQWMYHVHKKTSDVISIQQQDESEDSIKFYKEIFREIHISPCFKTDIEAWLQLALEYDPRRRGYRNYDSQNKELAIFTSLKALLDKKIITVFSVYNCEFYNYEIDDYTLIDTLQGWIERDIKITKNEQLLLSYKCPDIKLDGLATQIFDENYSEPMLFVYKKDEMLQVDIKPNHIPEHVKMMLHDATKNLQYYFQKRAYAHALYFIFNETKTYNTLLSACNLKIKNIVKDCDQTSHMCRNMNLNIEKLIALKDFSKEMLDLDYKQYLNNFRQSANHWTTSFDMIADKICKLHEACNRITIRHESVFRRASNLSVIFSKEYSCHNNHDLNELLDEGIECYSVVRTRSKDNRIKPENCKNMAKILYKVFRSRDKLLRDTNFKKFLQVIVDIGYEVEKMNAPLQTTTEYIENVKNQLVCDHKARQTKIWDLTIKQKPKSKSQEDQPITNFLIGNLNKNPENYGTPISLEKPLHFILGDPQKNNSSLESNSSYKSVSQSPVPPQNENKISSNGSLEMNGNGDVQKMVNGDMQDTKINKNCEEPKTLTVKMPKFLIGEPATDIINYNLSLRHDLQEKTNESFIKYKSIVNETLDFNFLNE